MKRFGRKGQGAMEYLMTYGWAILVVMIVGVVLWQLGIFGGGPSGVNTASGFGKIKVMEPSIRYTATSLSFSMMNGVGQGIANAWISLSGDCTVANASMSSDGSMGAGEVTSESFTCNSKASGQTFSVDAAVIYNVTVAGNNVQHIERGTIRGVAE